ncbi:MAG: hypothetical protein ACRC4M_01010 [Mycoplasma sp.]
MNIINDISFFENALANKHAHIVIMGDTVSIDKKAYEIKVKLEELNFDNVSCVDKQYASLNDLQSNIDVLILCMNNNKSIILLNDYFSANEDNKNISHIKTIIQPNAGSVEIEQLLSSKNATFTNGCILKYYKDKL